MSNTTVLVVLFCGLAFLAMGLYVAQRSRHPFDVRDILMDSATGRASTNAVILVGMALLSAWVVVVRQMADKDDVGSILGTVIGIFVGGRVAAQGISALEKRGNVPGSTLEQTTIRKETTRVDSPDAPPKEKT